MTFTWSRMCWGTRMLIRRKNIMRLLKMSGGAVRGIRYGFVRTENRISIYGTLESGSGRENLVGIDPILSSIFNRGEYLYADDLL